MQRNSAAGVMKNCTLAHICLSSSTSNGVGRLRGLKYHDCSLALGDKLTGQSQLPEKPPTSRTFETAKECPKHSKRKGFGTHGETFIYAVFRHLSFS
eukprot:6463712-Amphidinium_carterae.1